MNDDKELEYARNAALSDTGVLARDVLGFDYDRHWKTGERVTPGGIREDGPHGAMIDLLDSDSSNKLLMAPRGSYKTTCLQAYAIRRILKDPNVRILYVMATFDEAKKTVGAVKEHFERNEKLINLFGNYKPSRSEDQRAAWGSDKFTVGKRKDIGIKEPTFWASGTDKNSTGGHCDVLILDDLVNWQNVRTEDGIQKAIDCFRACQPLLDPGGTLVVTCTLYDDADLSSHIRNEMKDLFDILVLDSGVDIVRTDAGKMELKGQPIFKHQPIEFLSDRFAKMSPGDFSRQYLNRSLASGMALFQRTHFKSARWERWMDTLALYILTDTATGANEESCYSVIAVVGLDTSNHAFLCDMRVGHFTPNEFVTKFCDVVAMWQQKAQLRAALMEKIALNRVFQTMIQDALRTRGLKLHIVDVARGGGEPSKKQRIQRLHRRMEDGQFTVLDTVPRTFNDQGDVKTLWDPTGHKQDGLGLPDGELVREFIRFPVYPKNDIADAIADIDTMDSEGNRVCAGTSKAVADRIMNTRKSRGQVVTMSLPVNGRVQQVNILQAAAPTPRGNMWAELAGRTPR